MKSAHLLRCAFCLMMCLALVVLYVETQSLTASADTEFSVPSFFADRMIFEQEKPMNIWGISNANSNITADLVDQQTSNTIQTVKTKSDSTGKWELSFDKRPGGYDKYKIVIKDDGSVVKEINDVVIGVIWLATGQSNMEFMLSWSVGGDQAIKEANDEFLRVLLMPTTPAITGGYPGTPNYDIKGSYWVKGDNGSNISTMSAMAYWAAQMLRSYLNVPVGIINAPRGATTIQPWLSRESIENNEVVKEALTKNGLYYSLEDFENKKLDVNSMTALYNTKIAPLAGMNISGVLWCQGESNVDGKPNFANYYAEALKCLAEGYSEAFGFKNGDIPVIVANIASHPFNNDAQCIPKWIEEVDKACAECDNIINIPIYDVELTYKNPPAENVAYSIHPNSKRVPGIRLGLAAAYNFYEGQPGDYYAPRVTEYTVESDGIYVAFENTVNGLKTLDGSKNVHGFTIAGKDGVYIDASAEIVSEDTVWVWSDGLEAPVDFTYAFNSYSVSANLCNSYSLPAIPYRSNPNMKNYFCANDWMYCDDTEVWINTGITGEYQTTWQTDLTYNEYSSLEIVKSVKCDGVGSVELKYDGDAVAYANINKFLMPANLTRYNYLSVMISNTDTYAKGVKLVLGNASNQSYWCLGAVSDSAVDDVTVFVDAESGFTRYVFDLGNIYTLDDNQKVDNVSNVLRNATKIGILVEDSNESSIYIDQFQFGFSKPDELSYPLIKMYGDVNHDELITAADALLVLQAAVSKIQLSEKDIPVADVDNNEKITAADALLVLQKAVKKIKLFPVEE